MTRSDSRRKARERRNAAREQAGAVAAQGRRRRRLIRWCIAGVSGITVIAAVTLLAIGLTPSSTHSSRQEPSDGGGPAGPEGIAAELGTPLTADTTDPGGAAADGISCDSGEGAAEHIHVHLAIYVDGVLRPIPVGIGIVEPVVQAAGTPDAFAQATRCYYWLHVHAGDGVVHIESPVKRIFTLGQFFAVWQQPLSTKTVAGASGRQTVYVDGRIVDVDPADIPLDSRENIQIDIGDVVPFHPVDWTKSHL